MATVSGLIPRRAEGRPGKRLLPGHAQRCTVVLNRCKAACRPERSIRMKTVSFTDFRSQASAVFDAVERGETVVVLRHGKPVAEIHPISAGGPRTPAWRKPGPRLVTKGGALSKAILEERSREDVL
jgi:antitoxin (DNA-binding transcriptional repressor) of toxin-antitoxin stability system